MSNARILALLALSMLLPDVANAGGKAPKCKWDGEAQDAFSGADARFFRMSMYATGYVFHPVQDGKVAMEIRLPVGGMLKDQWTEPHRFLLSDKSVVELPLIRPAAGTIASGNMGVMTVYLLEFAIDAAVAQRMMDVGVSQDKVTPPQPVAAVTQTWDKGDNKDLHHILECALSGT